MLLKMPNNTTIHAYQNSIQVNRKLKEKRNHKLREGKRKGNGDDDVNAMMASLSMLRTEENVNGLDDNTLFGRCGCQ